MASLSRRLKVRRPHRQPSACATEQDNISSHLDLAPRAGFSWSVGAKDAAGRARTVVRVGFGVFYDRVSEDYTLRATRYDGVRQQQYVVADPLILDRLVFGDAGEVSNLPSVAALGAFAVPQTTWRLAPDLESPYSLQSSLSLERQLPGNFTLSTTVLATECRRERRSRNINAPTALGTRPLGEAAGNVYQLEATGLLNQYQAIVGVNSRASRKLTLFARYFFTDAHSDTDGAGSFPADQYDLAGEYGRSANDIHHRPCSAATPSGRVRLSPYVLVARPAVATSRSVESEPRSLSPTARPSRTTPARRGRL